MRSWMALVALLPACGFNSSSGQIDSGDGNTTPDASYCYGSFVRVCFPAAPTTARMLTEDTDIDTDSSPLCDASTYQSEYCVVASESLSLVSGKKLTAHGSKPLVLLATMRAELSGDIDVSSSVTRPQLKGPGANPAACSGATEATSTGTGGGFGGGFGGKGGDGSDGEPVDATKGVAAGALDAFPTTLRGGCPGGSGGLPGLAGEGSGGSGGGAIAVVAGRITIQGKINASGAAGRGGQALKSGGGGGGSGGMIVLDSSVIDKPGAKAALWANGGGGAQGGAAATGGIDGNESPAPDTGAAFTNSNKSGANGGKGSEGATLEGAPGKPDATTGGGGGGGGGGAGFIRAPGFSGPAVVSPAPL